MNTFININTEENGLKIFKIDEVILKNLYLTSKRNKVKENIRKFNIDVQKAKSMNDLGIKVSKHDKNVILTINFMFPQTTYQMLLNDKTKKEDILDSEHPLLHGFKPYLMSYCDLTKPLTLADLMNISDLNKQ